MEKVMFDVVLPATGRHYDFLVPAELTMGDAAELIARAMQVAEPSYYEAGPDAALMYVPTGEIQDPAAVVSEVGFSDGSRFVLV